MDPLIRDHKRVPLSGFEVVPLFFIVLVVVVPLWVAILVPLALISQGLIFLGNLFRSRPKKRSLPSASEYGSTDATTVQRKLDIVIYGATGFTGRMAALYVAKQYDKQFKWGIAGRRRDALEKVRLEMGSEFSDVPIIIADASDAASLQAMVQSTKVVVSTTGPFTKYGSDLVRLCAENGTHYCDITGEVDWVREMIENYDEAARKSGARIVHLCGHDSVPWDLSVMHVSKELKRRGDSLAQIHLFNEIVAAASGGTLATMLHILSDRTPGGKSSLGFDPLLKKISGEKCDAKFAARNQAMLGYSSMAKKWVGPFVMAGVNANCVRRSNAVLGYSNKLIYSEAQVYPNFFAGFVTLMLMIVFGTCLAIPLVLWFMLQSGIMPSPGQGPSESDMDKGFLKVTAIGTGASGGTVKSTFYFPTDPGYRDTARMLVEAGLVLALEIDKVKVGGGIWTPAACQGEAMTERLVASGSNFAIE